MKTDDRPRGERWDDRLMCHVNFVHYDFYSRRGQLMMADGDCCSMDGCTSLFEGIDQKAAEIITYSGAFLDTVYRKEHGHWKGYAPIPDVSGR